MNFDLDNLTMRQDRSLQNAINKQSRDLKKDINRQGRVLKKTIDEQEKQLVKAMAGIKFSISKEGRVRIPAKRRHEVEDKYYHKCAVCKKKPLGVTLQIHHKDMKNNNNRLSNLELLCPNHHIYRHSKAFRRRYRDSFGNYYSKLVKKGKIKKKRSLII